MRQLDHKEGWALKKWCSCTVVLEKSLESPLDWKEIKLVNPKGNQPWLLFGRTDAEAETPILWLPDVKRRLIRKDPDAGKTEGRKRRGQQRVRWLDGITNSMDKSLHTLGVGEGQGNLACCSPWGLKESDTTDDWTELKYVNEKYLSVFYVFMLREKAVVFTWIRNLLLPVVPC